MIKRKYLVTTIVEPFPLFYSHVNWPSERRRETAVGPFYAANMKTYESPEHHAFVEWRAAGLREAGWTVLVTEELR